MSDDEHRDDEGDEAAEAERRRQEQIAEENRRKKEAQARMKAAQAKKKSGKRKGLCLTPEKKKLLKNGQIQEVSSDSDSDDDTEPVMTSSQCFSSADALSEPSLDSVADEFPSDRDDCEDQSHDVISIASDSGISSNNSTLTREEALKLPDLRRLEEDLVQQNVQEIKTPEALEAPSRKLSFELPAKRRGIFVPSDRRVLERWSSQEKPTSPDKKEPAVDKWTAVNCAVRKQHASNLWLPNDAEMKDEQGLEGLQNNRILSGELKSLKVSSNTELISPRSQKNYGRPNRGSWLIDDDQSLETEDPPKIDAKAISSITKEILAISRVSSIDFTDGETRELKKSTNVADKTDTTDKVKALTAKFGRSSSILDTDNHSTNEMDPVLCSRSQKSKSIASAFESKLAAKDDHIYLSDRPKRTSSVLSRFQPQASTSNYSSCTLGRPKSFTSNLSGSRSFSRSLGDLSSPSLSSVDISIDTPKNIKSMREKFESKDSDSDDSVTLRRPRTTGKERAQTMVELKPPTTSKERARLQTTVEFKPQTAAEKRRTYQGDIDILRKSSGSAKSLAERFQTPTTAPRQTETKPVSAIVKREPSTVRSDLPAVKRDNKLSMTISMLKATDSINRQPKSSVVMETRGLKLGTRGLAAKFEQLEANVKAQPTLSSPGRRKSYGNPSEFFKPTTKVFHVFDDSELSKKSTAAPLDYPKDSAPVSTLSTKYATLDRNSKLSKSVEMTPREAKSLKEAAKVTKLSSKFDQNNSSSDSDSDKYSKASVKSIDSNNSPTVRLNIEPRMAQLSPRESSFTKRSFDTTDSAPETVIKFSVNNNKPESVSSSPRVTNDSETCSKNSMEDSKLGVSIADQTGSKNSMEDSKLGVSIADQTGSKNSMEDSELGVSIADQTGLKNSMEDSKLGVSIADEAIIVKSRKDDDKISVKNSGDDQAVSVKKSEISSEWRFLLDGDDDFDVTDSPALLSDKTRISRGQSSRADVANDVSAIDSVMVDTNHDLDWWEIKPKFDEIIPKFDEKSVEHVEEQIVVKKTVVSEKAIVKLEAPAVRVEIPELKTAETFAKPDETPEDPKQDIETESDIELKPEIHDETRSEIETSEYSETETSEMDSQSEYSEKASEYSELESEVGLASGLEEPSTSEQERNPLDIEYEELAKLDRGQLIMDKAAEEMRAEAKKRAEEKERYINEHVPPLSVDGMDKSSLLRKVQELHKLMSGKEEEKYDLELRIRKQDLEINEITSKVNDVKGKYNKPVLKKVTKTEKLSKVEKKGITDVRASLKSTGQSKYQLDDQPVGEPTTPDWRGGLGSKGKEGEEVNGDVGGGGEEVEAEA